MVAISPRGSERSRLLVVCGDDVVWKQLQLLEQLFAVIRVGGEAAARVALREQRRELVLVVAEDLGAVRCRELLESVRALDATLPVFVVSPDSWPDEPRAVAEGVRRLSEDCLVSESGRASLALDIERAVEARRRVRLQMYGQRGRRRSARSAKRFLVGNSEATIALRTQIEWAAASELNLLITGETGVGKSMVAEAVHALGAGTAKPFVVVEPTSLPASLFESELFGHVKGAFTGAVTSEIGAFEAADGGTLVLDEIGDLPLQLQVKLLRAVESKVIRRIGDSRELRLEVRVVTATNRALEPQVARGEFRADLYHRLNEIHIEIPPLRERRQDVIPLLRSFLTSLGSPGSPAPELAPDAERLLTEHPWPGNVRELRTLARRLVEQELPDTLREADLIPIFPARIDRGLESDGTPEERIRVFRRRVYLEELSKHGYDIRAAARAMRMPYATLRSRLVSLELLEVLKSRKSDLVV